MKFLLLLLPLLWLTACADQDDSVIRMGLASAPANLDPRFATDATSARINRLLYRRLVDFDDRVRPVPALASWQQLAPQHYRFQLQPARALFHDGTTLTAPDVAATYRYILDPANASPHRGALRLIEKIEVQDVDTL
ncbi:MAG: ABC transporter substrate-binding protein, partial [Gammaproteobacteria bacterium]